MKTASITVALVFLTSALSADPLNCNLAQYKPQPGLSAAVAEDTLAVTWDGDREQEVRLRLAIDGGTPTIRDWPFAARGASGRRW